jgi:hypothetical protein
MLKEHAPMHAKEGLKLINCWKNLEISNEVIFMFSADDIHHAKKYMDGNHEKARQADPNANVPDATFLIQ